MFDLHTWYGKRSAPTGGSTPVATNGADSFVLVEADDPKELVGVSLGKRDARVHDARLASNGEDLADMSWKKD